MSEPQIDRDTYRKIKKMSREELNDFLIRYANNLTQDSTVDLREMEKELLSIPPASLRLTLSRRVPRTQPFPEVKAKFTTKRSR